MIKKFCFILFFILFFILLLNIDSFATDVSFTDNEGVEYSVSLPSGVENRKYFICESIQNYIVLIVTNYNKISIDFAANVYLHYDIHGSDIMAEYYIYDSKTNSFGGYTRYYSIYASYLSSNGFQSYYCSEDLLVYCYNDGSGNFSSGELLCYNTSYVLGLTSENIDNGYRIYTNYFNISSGVQGYWTAYLWTGDGEIEDFDPDSLASSSWDAFINSETYQEENGNYYTRYYYDVSSHGEYYVAFFNSMTEDIDYASISIQAYIEPLELYLSTTENTTEPIYVLSNRYYYTGDYNASLDFLNNYDIDVSYGYSETYGYAPISVKGYDEEKQMYYSQYQFKIVVNGVYTFKILNFETQEISYKTFIVENIGIDNQWGEDVYYDNYNENGEFDPTPSLFLEYVDSTTVRIRTQPFSFNEIIMLQCFTKFENEEFSQNRNIYSYTVDTGNTIYNTDSGIKENLIDLYYFYLDVKVDGNYTFQFYNIELDKYTQSSIDVNIRQFIIDNIDNIDSFTDKMVAWSRLHFGFLTYPFELVINIFSRITNINFEEPILNIPELKDPFTGTTFLSATTYNLKNATEINSTTETLYNIYLVVVDVILIFSFVMLCKKIYEEVFK